MMPKPVSLPFKVRDPLPINSAFGTRPLYGDFHSGIDFNSTTGVVLGTAIPAAGAGKVIESYNGNTEGQTNWAKLRGTMVVIDHGDGWVTRYHMLIPNSNIPRGRTVKAGETIGKVGSSGKSTTGPHLHFELWKDGKAINPIGQLSYSPSALAGVSSSPFDNSPDPLPPIEIEPIMIRIQSPGRGIALIGPGYFRALSNDEEVQQAAAIMTKHLNGNDRQFDIWVSLAASGQGSATSESNSDKEVKASLKSLAATVAKLAEPEVVVRGANSTPTPLPEDGKLVSIIKKQDDADINTIVRGLDAKLSSVISPEIVVDYDKLAEKIVALLPSRAAATKEDVVEALQNVTLKVV